MTKSLRSEMPVVTDFIDALREAFGKEMIDAQIGKAVKNGEPTFWASENGHEIGVRDLQAKHIVAFDKLGNSFSVDVPEGMYAVDVVRKKQEELQRVGDIHAR